MRLNIFKRCKKTNKIIGININSAWYWILLPVTGFIALVWFLIRVIPKPSRISYPCQQAAFPMAVGFLSFLFGITGLKAVYRIIKNKKSLKSAALGILSVTVLCFSVYFISPILFSGCGGQVKEDNIIATLPPADQSDAAAKTPDVSEETSDIETDMDITSTAREEQKANVSDLYNIPAKGTGIFPGRVAYIHNPKAVKYNESGYWWEDQYTIPEEVDKMLTEALYLLTGKNSIEESWEALFRNFNGGESYKKGEKIVIKLNLNLDDEGKNNRQLPSPQLLESLVSQLVHVMGADPKDITITDPSRNIGDSTYDRFANNPDAALRDVRFVGRNRINAIPDKNNPIYFADGQKGYVPTDYTAAKYLINLAVFRPHYMFGITLCGKNHFGSVYFDGDDIFSPVNMHGSWDRGYGEYSHITDLMAFRHLGGKTLLYMIDGLYFAYHNEDETVRRMQTFNGEYPASLFISQDPCAIDSVAYDYIKAEVKVNDKPNSSMPGDAPDNYLIEAAYINAPPSNTDYNPNRDGIRASLGAFEHWNNDSDKQYSRNLGKDYGIEFVRGILSD